MDNRKLLEQMSPEIMCSASTRISHLLPCYYRKLGLKRRALNIFIETCNDTSYNHNMIVSWQHKGLKKFYETGSAAGIKPDHVKRLKVILQRLNAAIKPDDMNTPGMRWHALKGELKGHYSVSVSENWRVIYKFEGQDAILVDYLDYH